MTKWSVSIQLALNIATQEAINAEFGNVEPEHILEAILKMADIPIYKLAQLANDANVIRQLTEEMNMVAKDLVERNIDSTSTRRLLRKKLGTGGVPFKGGSLGQSQACKDLFDAVIKKATDSRYETIMLIHLLEIMMQSPTPVMAEVLGSAIGPKIEPPADAPLLNTLGRNLTIMARKGNLDVKKEKPVEAMALVHDLAGKANSSILLIADREEDSRAVVVTAVKALLDIKDKPDLRSKQVIDLSGVPHEGKKPEEGMENLRKCIEESRKHAQVILFLPELKFSPDEAGSEWAHMLEEEAGKGGFQCICSIRPGDYQNLTALDPAWSKNFRLIWIHDLKKDIPDEL